MANQNEDLVKLRNHVRLTWRASVAAFYNVQDILGPRQEHLLQVNPMFHTLDAAAYAYLATSRSFIRTADKAAGSIGIRELQEYRKNLDNEFPGHRSGRDIIEHFEDYALGEGKLQKAGRVFAGDPISVYVDERNLIHIRVFDLDPIDMSKLAWWIDGFNFFIEKHLHDAIEPGVEWKGVWPQYNYVAPPDWNTR